METFIISILPVILISLYVYDKDKFKEPTKLLIKLFFGGFLSCIITLVITYILEMYFPIVSADINTLNLFELAIRSFLFIALVEEFSKWIISYKISYNNKEFDELYDMIIYCIFVSLGFAFVENILYVSMNGITVGLLRAILSIPGHACDGVLMGYYLGLAKEKEIANKDNKTELYLSIIIPTITHGIYDFCLFVNNIYLIEFFFIFVIFLYIISIKKIKKVSSLSKNIRINKQD